MAQTLNLLIHGNSQGWQAWYNAQELSSDESEYLKSFYGATIPSDPAPLFAIDTKVGADGKAVSYYHYLITQGVFEASGRSSNYVGITLRIGEGVSLDTARIYHLLDGFFRAQVIGILVDKKGEQGYQFRVGALKELETDFIRWENDVTMLFSLICQTELMKITPAQPRQTKPFALADLSEVALRKHLADYLAQGMRIIFSSSTPSQQVLRAKKQIEQESVALIEDKKKLELRLQELEKSGGTTRQQLQQVTRERDEAKGVLAEIKGILSGQALSSKDRSIGSSHKSHPEREGEHRHHDHHYTRERMDDTLVRRIVAILLILILALQVYTLFSRPKEKTSVVYKQEQAIPNPYAMPSPEADVAQVAKPVDTVEHTDKKPDSTTKKNRHV